MNANTLVEVFRLKHATESAIRKEIEKFTQATRLEVKDLRLDKVSTGTIGDPNRFAYSVELEVSL
jgi:hypothetical protein